MEVLLMATPEQQALEMLAQQHPSAPIFLLREVMEAMEVILTIVIKVTPEIQVILVQ
jgi:hypothetical protein